MSREISQIVADIDGLRKMDGDGLNRLELLIGEYFASPAAATHIDVWFRLFERFPEEHGHGVFWSILHGLEAQPGFADAVVASVRRRPSHYPVTMITRMLNAEVSTAAGMDLVELLRQVVSGELASADVREDAREALEYQCGIAEPRNAADSR